ncbi:MAG: hypothetical protein ACI4U2_01780, partial [Christensenellaceae bacterium]
VPVEEVPVEEVPVEEAPVEEAPVEEVPVEEVPVEEAPVEEVPVEEVPVEEVPVEEVPVEEVPVEEAPVEEAPVEKAPVEEVPVEEVPVEEVPVEEVPAEAAPVREEPKAPSTATPRPIPEGQYVPPRPVYGGARKNGYNPTTPHEGFYYPVYEDALASQQVARQAEEEAMHSEEQDVIAQIYANAIDRSVPPVDFSFDPIHVDPTQVTGNVEFFNIHERAEQDKITIRTSGSYHPKSIPEAETAQTSAPTAFFNKGRALLFASSATFGVMLIEFVLLLALMDPLSVSLQGIIFFGVTAVLMELFFVILYFKGFGKNASKSTSSNYVVVDLIVFILLTIATIGIAIFQGSNLSEISVLVNRIILPVLLAFNIVVFALFYRLFKNKQ